MAENPIGEQKNPGLSDAEIEMAKKIHNEKKIREQFWREYNKAEDMLNRFKKKLAETTNPRQSKDLERKIKQLQRALLTKSNLPTPLAECNYYDKGNCNKNVLCYWNDHNRNCNARIPFVWAKRGLIPGERIKEGDRWLITIPREENLSDEERRIYGEWRMRTRKERRDLKKNEENERFEQENKSPETAALEEELYAALPVDLKHPQFSIEANRGDPKEKDPNKNKLEIGGGKRKTKRKRRKRKTMKKKRLKRKKTRKKRKSRKRRKTKKRSKRR